MKTMLVWLLVISSDVHGGSVTSVTSQVFPTLADCEQVQKNLPAARYRTSRCIQSTIIVSKP